jgi:predicted ferric reductase
MNHEFSNDVNSPAWKSEHLIDRASFANSCAGQKRTADSSNICIPKEISVKQLDKLKASAKAITDCAQHPMKLAQEKNLESFETEIVDDKSLEPIHSLGESDKNSVDDDELAMERHSRSFQISSISYNVSKICSTSSNSSLPSSGSFACDDFLDEPDTGDDLDFPNEYRMYCAKEELSGYHMESKDIADSMARNEPTLDELMSIIEFDEPCFLDDSPNDNDFNLLTSALSINPKQKQQQNSSSDLFPKSSIEFVCDDDDNTSGRAQSVGLTDVFCDEHEPPNEKNGKITEVKEIEGEFCSPNRPHPALEYPLLYFLLRRCPWLFEKIKFSYASRWRLSYPLQRNFPYGATIQKMGIHSTWGELLLLIPFFASIALCLVFTFVFPSVSLTGKIARYGLIAVFVFAQRNSLITLLLGMPCDRANFYHKLSGRIAGVASLLHASAFFLDPTFRSTHREDFFGGAFTGQVNVSGTVMLLLVVLIIVSSIARVRRWFYELFYYVHVISVFCLVAGAFFHTGILLPIIAALLWGADLFIRSVVMARTLYPKKATLKLVSDTVIEVSFPKTRSFAYNPGQYVYLAIPELSWLQWHPFSISSSPKQRVVTLHIRKAGNWTSSLFNLCNKKTEVSILLEGPYGNLSVDLMNDRKYKNVMLISGGIGSKYGYGQSCSQIFGPFT